MAGLASLFGPWHTIYTRLNRWSKRGIIERVFTCLQEEQILAIKLEVLSLDSTSIKVHPDVPLVGFSGHPGFHHASRQ